MLQLDQLTGRPGCTLSTSPQVHPDAEQQGHGVLVLQLQACRAAEHPCTTRRGTINTAVARLRIHIDHRKHEPPGCQPETASCLRSSEVGILPASLSLPVRPHMPHCTGCCFKPASSLAIAPPSCKAPPILHKRLILCPRLCSAATLMVSASFKLAEGRCPTHRSHTIGR